MTFLALMRLTSDVLTELEWSAYDETQGHYEKVTDTRFCPECRATQTKGHESDCRLARSLAGIYNAMNPRAEDF